MPARQFVPLADGAQVIIRYGLGLGVISNRLFFRRRSGVVDNSTLQDLADGVQQWAFDGPLVRLSHDVVLTNCWAIDWTVQFGTLIASAGPTGVGSDTDPSYSANVALLLRFTGSQPPRNFHNWHFIGGIPLGVLTLNTFDPTWLESMRNAYIDLIDRAPNFGPFPAWEWVVTSQSAGGSPRSTQFAASTDFITTPHPYSVPRRKRLLVT